MSYTRTQIFAVALVVVALALPHIDGAQAPVDLGSAGTYAILAKSGITSSGATSITGNVGISPAAAATVTGFSLVVSSDGTYAKSNLVGGNVYAADYAAPTPANLIKVTGDMEAAYTEASNRPNPDKLNHNAGALNGDNLSAGLYKFTTPLTVGGTVTLSGSSSDVFIFQISGTTTFNGDANIVLDGVKAENVFFVSGGQIVIAGGAQVNGILLGKAGAAFAAAAKVQSGRVLVQTSCTLIGNTISQPQ
jgi:hypothetical protein